MADSASPAAAAVNPAEAAARRMYNNPTLYPEPTAARPRAEPPKPSTAVKPGEAATPAAKPAEAAGRPAQASPKPPVRSMEEIATRIYDATAPTRGFVDWGESPAKAADYKLTTNANDVLDTSDAGRAAMTRLRQGFEAAGAGATLARELFQDAVAAHQGASVPRSRASAETELRRHYGERYDDKIAAAQDLVKRAAAKCPEIVEFLERTRLGDDPAFIRKVVAAAGRRGRR